MKKESSEKEDKLLEEIYESLDSLKDNWYHVIPPVISDLLFLLIYGAILGYFGDAIINNLYSLGASMMQTQESQIGIILKSIFWSLAEMAVALYITYVVLQGISWRFSKAIAAQKDPIMTYLKRFSLVNIPWFLLFAAYSTISFLVGFYNRRTIYASIILYIFLAALIYFAVISYALAGRSASRALSGAFQIGTAKFLYVAPRILIAAAALYFVGLAVSYAGSLSFKLMIVLGVLVLLPFVTLVRVYLHIILKPFSKKFI